MARLVVGDDRNQRTRRRHSLSPEADHIRHRRERSLRQSKTLSPSPRMTPKSDVAAWPRRVARRKAARKDPTQYNRSAQYIC
jgi:hypothetical protein